MKHRRNGDYVTVFDADAWRKVGHDVGDNECFWKRAKILHTSTTERGEQVATVEFADGHRISGGHFTAAMRDA